MCGREVTWGSGRSRHTSSSRRANGSVATGFASVAHGASIARGAFPARRAALAGRTIGAWSAGRTLVSGGALQSVSSRAIGTTTLASRTRFTFLAGEARSSWSAWHTTGSNGALLSCKTFCAVCASSAHGARVTLGAFRSGKTDGTGTASHSFGAVFAIAPFCAAAATRALKASRANCTFFTRLALLSGETRQALSTLSAFCACGAVQTRVAVTTRQTSRSLCARRTRRKPVSDLIFNVRIKSGDASNFAVQTVHFVLNIVELVNNGLVAVSATLGERVSGVALHTDTCNCGNRQHKGNGSYGSKPALRLIWRVPIHDLIRAEVHRGGGTYCHGRSTSRSQRQSFI